MGMNTQNVTNKPGVKFSTPLLYSYLRMELKFRYDS